MNKNKGIMSVVIVLLLSSLYSCLEILQITLDSLERIWRNMQQILENLYLESFMSMSIEIHDIWKSTMLWNYHLCLSLPYFPSHNAMHYKNVIKFLKIYVGNFPAILLKESEHSREAKSQVSDDNIGLTYINLIKFVTRYSTLHHFVWKTNPKALLELIRTIIQHISHKQGISQYHSLTV